MKINAYAAMNRGEPLRAWSYDAPTLGADECVVRVHYCGICHSDLHMIDNDWRRTRYPLVPGHEIVGEVVETGRNVTNVANGARVGIGWQRSACLACDECLSGREHVCPDRTGLITDGHGGFAEHLVVDSRFVFSLPDGITSEKAGPLLCGGATVYSALRRAGLTSGGAIGVIGVGGLGHLAIQFAANLGNSVTAFTTSRDKAEEAALFGADDAVVTAPGAPIEAKRRFDIIINTAPHDLPWEAYLALLATNGVLTFVGIPPHPVSVPIHLLLDRQSKVTASLIGSRIEIRKMLEIADECGVEPKTELYPMTEVNAALDRVRTNKVRYRAVVKA